MFQLALELTPELLNVALGVVAIVALVVAKTTRENHAGISAVATAVGEVLGGHPDGAAILQDILTLTHDRGNTPHTGPLVAAFNDVGGEKPPTARPNAPGA